MTGIYIHIPFCRQACRYCDFYFTVSLKYIDDYLKALEKEIIIRKEELRDTRISTIYLGGGTPSVISAGQLEYLLDLLRKTYNIDPAAEITVEANPDDLDRNYPEYLLNSGFNRISIGIQSFIDKHLVLMRRSHNANQAERAILNANEAGFNNITIDLIYGIPGLTIEEWEKTLHRALAFPIQHLSAYHLTYEQGTVFDHWLKIGRINQVGEEISLEQYRILRELTAFHGFEHYEISNFARKDYRSRHNLIYWNQDQYIGLGPGAHSFNGKSRRWNVSSLKKYISALGSDEIYFESETPDETERYHDYIITALRTSKGAERNFIERNFNDEIRSHFNSISASFIKSGTMYTDGKFISMTPESWFISDTVMRDFLL